MLSRILAIMAVLALVLLAAQAGLATDKNEKTHEGKVVAAGNGKLTMADKDGKNEHTHTVPADAVISCDGKACKLEDLKPGTEVKVIMKDEQTVSRIEGTTKEK
jgi:co-chaperonin GroES (HSP10)